MGPALDGSLKPDVVAPFCWVGPASLVRTRSSPAADAPPKDDARTVEVPAGYEATCGTSYGGPSVGGAIALLLSAARQSGIHASARDLEDSLVATARPVPGARAMEQGGGIVDVGAAWELLRHRTQGNGGCLEVRVPPSAGDAASSDAKGIFEREGWRPGQSGTRTMFLTRRCGPQAPQRFSIAWREGADSFASPDEVTLPLGREVGLPIRISPLAAGLHTGLVRIAGPVTGAHKDVPVTIVVAEDMRPGASLKLEGVRGWGGTTSHFFRIPRGTPSVTFTSALTACNQPFRIGTPTGQFAGFIMPGPNGPATMTVHAPEPGVWEVQPGTNPTDGRVHGRDEDPRCHADLPYRVDVVLNRVVLANVSRNPPAAVLRNDGPSLQGFVSRSLATEVRTYTVPQGGPGRPFAMFDVEVTKGISSLDISLAGPGSDTAPLFLYWCGNRSCDALGDDWPEGTGVAAPGQRRWLYIPDAQKGRWRVVVGLQPTLRQPPLRLTVRRAGDRFGRVSVLDSPAHREPGESWTLPLRIESKGEICSECRLQAQLLVQRSDALRPARVGESYATRSSLIPWQARLPASVIYVPLDGLSKG
jgi:hypothetical protein